jgi:hypothetical protein
MRNEMSVEEASAYANALCKSYDIKRSMLQSGYRMGAGNRRKLEMIAEWLIATGHAPDPDQYMSYCFRNNRVPYLNVIKSHKTLNGFYEWCHSDTSREMEYNLKKSQLELVKTEVNLGTSLESLFLQSSYNISPIIKFAISYNKGLFGLAERFRASAAAQWQSCPFADEIWGPLLRQESRNALFTG